MRVLTKNKFKINGGDHTAKKTFIFPVDQEFSLDLKKMKQNSNNYPKYYFSNIFFYSFFLIDNTQPNRTIAIKIKGNE